MFSKVIPLAIPGFCIPRVNYTFDHPDAPAQIEGTFCSPSGKSKGGHFWGWQLCVKVYKQDECVFVSVVVHSRLSIFSK